MTEELKVKLGKYVEQLEEYDEVAKKQIIAEIDCLANLIIDSYLAKK